jgi:hypothetical protein
MHTSRKSSFRKKSRKQNKKRGGLILGGFTDSILNNDRSLYTDENPYAEGHEITGGRRRRRKSRGGDGEPVEEKPHEDLKSYLQSVIGSVPEQTAAVESADSNEYTSVNLENGNQLGGRSRRKRKGGRTKHRRKGGKFNLFGLFGSRKSKRRNRH